MTITSTPGSPRSAAAESGTMNVDSVDIASCTDSSPSSSQAPARGRRLTRGRSVLVAGAAMVAVVATACFPTGPVESWVPDLNGDGKISEQEIEAQKQVIIDNVVAAIESQRRDVQLHPVLTCIRRHESDRGAYPHTNGYAAKNSRSTASGAYQFINGTWKTVSARAGHAGYATARSAPWYVQDAVAMWVIKNMGTSPWRGSGC